MLPNYATDLLHAHQIRRENVFLQKELETCRNDHVEIQSAIKRIQVACNSSNDHARQAHDLTTIHQRQLQDQAQLISCLQDTNEALQNEFMILSKAFAQFGYTEQQKRAELESKVKKLEEGATEAAETLVQNTTKIWKEIDALSTTVDAKAEGGLVNLLVDRLNNLGSLPCSPSASTSCIVESIEQPGPTSSEAGRSNSPRQLSVDDTGYSEIQVKDSQRLATTKIGKKERFKNLDLKQFKDQRATQSPDDVDLDANAPTISYGGHYYPGKNKAHEDSLRMLPELSVQASRLAMINTLMQGRYEDWRTYHGRGAIVKDSLPQTFEAAIVQRFVDGIFGGKQRAQCVQWLSDEGWKWDNVTRFGNLCSQIDDRSRPEDDSMSSNESRATATYDIVPDRLEGLEAEMGTGAPPKPTQPVKRSKWSVTTLRRSQRLIERSQTKLKKEMKGTTGSAFSGSVYQDKCQHSRHVEQTVVLNQSENAVEISGGCIISEGHRQGSSETRTRFEDEDSESSQTEMLSDVQTANNASLEHSQGVDGLPRKLSIPLPPLKRTRTQSSEQARGGQKRTKNQYLPLLTPPEIPILPTSTDE